MLNVENITAGYGRITVVSNVSFSVPKGSITALLGSNGAGKTTLVKTLSGLLKPLGGRVSVDGEDVTGSDPAAVTRLGMRILLDGHRVFPDLTVADNLRIAAISLSSRSEFNGLCAEYFELFPILAEKRNRYARDMSGGQQQMLALTQAFLAKPKVLLCDEPSIGPAQALIPSILSALRNYASKGAAVVLVEQQIRMALQAADEALVLDRGEIRLAGAASEFLADDRIGRIYMGGLA